MASSHEISPIHLKPAADLAERVLLPGDPHRALGVAQHLLEGPRMFNHHRGLWGYTGIAPDGHALTIQATGMGGPSAAIVAEELVALGARRLVRVGTCEALVDELELGTLVAVEHALAEDGVSAALGDRTESGAATAPGARAPLREHGRIASSPVLLERLVEAGARPATVASTDLFYDPRAEASARWVERGAVAVELETAALFQVAALREVEAASVLGVTGARGEVGPRRATLEQVEEIGLRSGEAGFAALRARTR